MEEAERRRLNEAMVRLADGDRSAFSPVFERLWPLLVGFSTRLVRDRSEAEDVAQHALLKVFEHADRFDRSKDAAGWALSIAAHEAFSVLRRTGRTDRVASSALEGRADARAGPEAAVIDRDLLSAALDALGALSSEDVETLSAAWGGRRPDVAGATFRKRVQRATERLRAAWRSRRGSL